MHPSSYDHMGVWISQFRLALSKIPSCEIRVTTIKPECPEPLGRLCRVGDVGAADVNGTYRPLVETWGSYTGIDLAPGPNVDLVGAEYEVPGGPYDLILCGQVLEHVQDTARLVKAIADALVPGGVCFLTAPHAWPVHRFPVDYWRILPDGMDWLLRQAGLAPWKVYTLTTDTWGVGIKPASGELVRSAFEEGIRSAFEESIQCASR